MSEKIQKTKFQKSMIGIGIALLILVLLSGTITITWYAYMVKYGGERFTSTTMYLNQITDAEGVTENIVNVKYNSNIEGNGLECLDIKFSNFTDEKQENIYWQGVQYVANSADDKIKWVLPEEVMKNKLFNEAKENDSYTCYNLKKEYSFVKVMNYFAEYMAPYVGHSVSRYDYQGLKDSEEMSSTNPITNDSYFTIETDEQLYYLQFRGDNYVIYGDDYSKDFEPIAERSCDYWLSAGYTNVYYNYSFDYFAYQIYNIASTLPAGSKGYYTMELGDIFKYFYADADKCRGDEVKTDDTELVKNEIKTYFTIYIEVSGNGIRNATDSMFGIVHNSANYVLGGQTNTDDYFAGQSIIDVTLADFTFVRVQETYVALKLKQSFIDTYINYSKSIALRITIDLDIFKELNVEYIGFTADSGLEHFTIYSIEEVQ